MRMGRSSEAMCQSSVGDNAVLKREGGRTVVVDERVFMRMNRRSEAMCRCSVGDNAGSNVDTCATPEFLRDTGMSKTRRAVLIQDSYVVCSLKFEQQSVCVFVCELFVEHTVFSEYG